MYSIIFGQKLHFTWFHSIISKTKYLHNLFIPIFFSIITVIIYFYIKYFLVISLQLATLPTSTTAPYVSLMIQSSVTIGSYLSTLLSGGHHMVSRGSFHDPWRLRTLTDDTRVCGDTDIRESWSITLSVLCRVSQYGHYHETLQDIVSLKVLYRSKILLLAVCFI